MDTLTAEKLAAALQEPKKGLLARVLTMLGQKRCAAILADTLTIESQGGMLTRAGDRRRSSGGTFFALVKQQCTRRERHALFAMQPSTKRRKQTTPPNTPATAAPPVSLTLDLWKGLQPLSVTATLKLVLRDHEPARLAAVAMMTPPRTRPAGAGRSKQRRARHFPGAGVWHQRGRLAPTRLGKCHLHPWERRHGVVPGGAVSGPVGRRLLQASSCPPAWLGAVTHWQGERPAPRRGAVEALVVRLPQMAVAREGWRGGGLCALNRSAALPHPCQTRVREWS